MLPSKPWGFTSSWVCRAAAGYSWFRFPCYLSSNRTPFWAFQFAGWAWRSLAQVYAICPLVIWYMPSSSPVRGPASSLSAILITAKTTCPCLAHGSSWSMQALIWFSRASFSSLSQTIPPSPSTTANGSFTKRTIVGSLPHSFLIFIAPAPSPSAYHSATGFLSSVYQPPTVCCCCFSIIW